MVSDAEVTAEAEPTATMAEGCVRRGQGVGAATVARKSDAGAAVDTVSTEESNQD